MVTQTKLSVRVKIRSVRLQKVQMSLLVSHQLDCGVALDRYNLKAISYYLMILRSKLLVWGT